MVANRTIALQIILCLNVHLSCIPKQTHKYQDVRTSGNV